ncbi:DUF1127 domain-containing protein [Roseovarius salis]|uniref:DUF1127 domain-containing protein n=1 Tax=Roseovarius salis TaxID=3376063 RepID=UPI0037C68BAE
MNMATANRRSIAPSAMALEISSRVYHATQAVHDYMWYRATLRELSRLDATQLADLGLRRAELKRTAREAVYGR